LRVLPAGDDTVRDGKYTVAEWKPSGYPFEGSTAGFTVGGKTTDATGIWRSGHAESLYLHAD